MKNKIFSAVMAAVVAVQMCAVSAVFAGDGFSEDFESYEAGGVFAAEGWSGNTEMLSVIYDPITEGVSNKVLQFKNTSWSRSIKKSFDAMDGVSDISFLMAWDNVQSYSHSIAVRSGGNLITRFGVFRGKDSGNHLGVLNKDATLSSGTTDDADLIKIKWWVQDPMIWYNVKIRVDCNSQTFDVVIASKDTVIDEDMMENPENYQGLSHLKDQEFITKEDSDGNKIDTFDSISIDSSTSENPRVAFYDNISVTPFVPVPKYNVTFRDWDGTETTQVIREGKMAEIPENPIRPGYIFDGWFLNGKLYNFETPVTQNIVLEAQYTKRMIALDETFEEYPIDTDIKGQDGWSGGGNADVIDDVLSPGENKVLSLSGISYNVSRTVEPTNGIFDVSYNFNWDDADSIVGQGMYFKCGDTHIARLGIFRNQTDSWRNDFGFYKKDASIGSGTTNGNDYNSIQNGVYPGGYFVKLRFDFTTQTVTAAIAKEEITDNDMADLAAAKEAGKISSYCENIPFLNNAEYLDTIIFEGPYKSNNKIYYDNLYIANIPEKEAVYAINNASWSQDGENVSVSANITKGPENAVIFTAVYNDENELIAADVNRGLSSVSEGETYNYQVQLSTTAADNVKIMVWDKELIPKANIAIAEFVQ